MDTGSGHPMPDIMGMDKPNSSSVPTALLWITFILALGISVFFLMASRSALNAVEAKMASRDEIVSELESPSYVSVQEKATAFKEAFEILNTLVSVRAPKKEILDGLYQNFTNDVYVKSLALGDGGSLAIDGATASYRSVADFMIGLKQNKRISNLKLNNVSVDASDDVDPKLKVVFNISATLDLAKERVAVSDLEEDLEEDSNELTDSTDESSSYTGYSDYSEGEDSYDDSSLSPSGAATWEGDYDE